MHDGQLESLTAFVPEMDDVGVARDHCRRIDADLALHQGRFDDAVQIYEELLGRRPDDVGVLNQLVWAHLCGRTLTPEHADRATVAVMGNPGRTSLVHTAACVYADLGMISEARELVQRLTQVREAQEPEADDWFVLGLIAERLGEHEAAGFAYERAASPTDKRVNPSSPASLARRRFEELRHVEEANLVRQ